MATYPDHVIDTLALYDNVTNDTLTHDTHPDQHNKLADEIIAVETELGADPKGGYGSVVTRLADVVHKTATAPQTISSTGDFTPVRIKKRSNTDTSDLFEVQDETGATITYVDRNGSFSAQSLRIAGTFLASTHLADSASLARLSSPAFTGTPTAPTPPPGDNSTRLATTAFVAALGGGGGGGGGGFAPTGVVIPYAGHTAPDGWLICDGSAVSRTTYANLFSVIGTDHGAGDGSTTFNIPDARGRVITGVGPNADVNAVGKNEGAAAGNRRVKHFHSSSGLTASHSLSINSGGSHSHSLSGSASGTVTGSTTVSGNTSSIGSHQHGVFGGGEFAVQDTPLSGGLVYISSKEWGTAGTGVKVSTGTSFDGGHSHSFSGTGSFSGTFSGTLSGNTNATTHSHPTGDFSGGISVGGNVGPTAAAPQDGPAFLALNQIIRT